MNQGSNEARFNFYWYYWVSSRHYHWTFVIKDDELNCRPKKKDLSFHRQHHWVSGLWRWIDLMSRPKKKELSFDWQHHWVSGLWRWIILMSKPKKKELSFLMSSTLVEVEPFWWADLKKRTKFPVTISLNQWPLMLNHSDEQT